MVLPQKQTYSVGLNIARDTASKEFVTVTENERYLRNAGSSDTAGLLW